MLHVLTGCILTEGCAAHSPAHGGVGMGGSMTEYTRRHCHPPSQAVSMSEGPHAMHACMGAWLHYGQMQRMTDGVQRASPHLERPATLCRAPIWMSAGVLGCVGRVDFGCATMRLPSSLSPPAAGDCSFCAAAVGSASGFALFFFLTAAFAPA